ncbi:MAG: hypothetical protein LUQ11_07425 [Methylococcaceae bacterium]|nr:hypothetical protein [Methylococcaceae bacterium]
MNRLAFILTSSVCGLGVCLGFVWLSQTLGISVKFPSPGGENDFALRAQWFFFGVCPAFLMLGAWIGYAGFGHTRRWLSMWTGALLGAAIVFAAARLLQGQIETLSDDGSANHAVLVFYLFWTVSSALGARIVLWRH